MTIGKLIKEARKNAGFSQRELAEKSGTATGTIQQYERGVRQPRLEQLLRIADALDVSIFYFTDAENENGDDQIVTAVEESLDADIAIERIGKSLYKLNQAGKTEAVKRVEELTEIKKYQR